MSDGIDQMFDDIPETTEVERKRLARAEAAAQREQEEDDRWLASCLATKIGRRVLFKHFNINGLWDTKFGCGPTGFPHPEATWHELGRKDVVRRLYDRLQRLDHPSVFLMMCENDPVYAASQPAEVRRAS